jgi:cobalt-zinc-cadmium efflux system outer membrane protein
MHAHRLVALGIGLAAIAPGLTAEPTPSYSLKEIQRIAREAHPTLESANAALEASQGALRQARAYPNLELAFAAGPARPRAGGDSGMESAILLVQPIEVGGIRRWRARSAELRLRGAAVDRALAETVVDSTVSRLVYAVLLERRRAEIARKSAEVARRLEELLRQRVELGESSPMETARARAEWFSRQREVLVADTALAAAETALDLFCVNRLPRSFGITETLKGSGATSLPDDLVERLRAGNPVLLRAGVAVLEAEARTELARKEVFPGFNLVASHETELDRVGTSLGVGMTLPLWNRNRGAIAAASADRERAKADGQTLALELETSLEQASAVYHGARAAIQLHDQGWTAAARKSYEIATFSFENGEASLLEVLDAQHAFLAVNLAEAESWALLAFARAEIERLIAGPLELENNDESR